MVAALQRRFPSAAPTSRDRYSSDPQAFSEFMAGLRDSYGDRREGLESAVQHLTAAVESDPEFPLAHAWLSYVSMNLYFTFDPRPIRLEQAEYHSERALTLDPALPEGHLARAFIQWSPAKGFQHADALEALGRVVAVQPGFEQAHNRIASISLHIGRLLAAVCLSEPGSSAFALAMSGVLLTTLAVNARHLYGGDGSDQMFTILAVAVFLCFIWSRATMRGSASCPVPMVFLIC